MTGARYISNGRQVEIIGAYAGHDRDDPPGFYYRYVGEKAVHWITCAGAAVRFTKEESNGNDAGASGAPSPQDG